MRATTAPCILASGMLLAGCAFPSSPPDREGAGTAPPMTGPWAEEFEEAYASATTDVERTALEDGRVSEQEYAEMVARFSQCAEDAGISFGGFEPDGSAEFEVPSNLSTDRGNELMDDCSISSGESTVGALYHWVNRNPDNLDENDILTRCLVDSGVVEPGYTAEQFQADDLGDATHWITDSESARETLAGCESDPLGLLGMRDR